MCWDRDYEAHERIWGEGPSELAVAALKHLAAGASGDWLPQLIDIGCGYGRDALYISERFRCGIVGIDLSPKAIEIASNAARAAGTKNVTFRCCDFAELDSGAYDIVFLSNVYQILRKDERQTLLQAISRILKPGGRLFLSTLSVRDPQHYGKGIPVAGDPNSFLEAKYVHLSSTEELVSDFALFVDIKELYEHEYDEPRATGEVHHHISWIMIGRRLRNMLPRRR